MKRFSHALLIALAATLLPSGISADGKKLRTKLNANAEKSLTSGKGKGKASADSGERKAEAWIKVSADSLGKDHPVEARLTGFDPQSISFTGYDKQATASRETFHVVNRSAHTLRKMDIEIVYQDMKGRMLHKRKATVLCNIPAGETHKTDIRTWDTQLSFYYYLSNPPRRVATPYQVEIHPLAFWLTPEESGDTVGE
ncbi:MAG: hypothetical protein K2K64_08540 [Muribaculaceae bacterium]|nr:hypothetical protein [Muribaculaceae bacterium]